MRAWGFNEMRMILLWTLILLSVVNIALADLQYAKMKEQMAENRRTLANIDARVNNVEILLGRLAQK
jgi:uncharacterized membrane protein YidH (DUF202 family)